MRIYDSSGYVNVRGILDEGYPFNFLVGGRGTGKTYTTLKVAKEDGRRFMLMRRTQSQADLISKPEFSVFKPLNEDLGWNVMVKSISKYNSMFYEPGGDAEEMLHPIGYTCALSTLSNMNRNRELKGIAPIQMVCLANANDITNPVFESLKLIRIADKMQKGNSDRWTDDKRGIQLIMLHRSPISRKKSDTVLYNLTDGSEFANMALDNDFNVDRQHVRPRPLSEFTPICSIGELCIYRHKSENRLYATTHLSGIFNKKFSLSDTDRLHYQRIYRSHWDMYIGGKIDFEDVLSEKMFIKYWDTP